ncbi:MAG: hypothetical protein AAGE52_29475 [Myxococcota bacterium]
MLTTLTRAQGLQAGRLELHWAAQILATIANSLGDAKDDFSHTALRVENGRLQVNVGNVTLSLDGGGALQIARGADARTLPLVGLTFEQALEESVYGLKAVRVDVEEISRLEHDLPAHPVADGGAFEPFPPEAAEILRWLSAGAAALAPLEDFGPLYIWPHHFDVARLRKVREERTVGAGLSPGDGSYDEPYFYVTPWPYPDADKELPPLSVGTWHREGWTGAVLRGSEILDADNRAETLSTFLREAVAAATQLAF